MSAYSAEQTFLEDIRFLHQFVRTPNAHLGRQSAVILYRLLLDAHPLAQRVARSRDAKLTFVIAGVEGSEEAYRQLVGDPNISLSWRPLGLLPEDGPRREVKLGSFINQSVGFYEGQSISVANLIKIVRNNLGGAHWDEPKMGSLAQTAIDLDKIVSTILASDLPPLLQGLLQVAMVTIKSTENLICALRS